MDYLYEAVDPSGQTVLGKIEANDEVEVRRKLTQMGYRPQTVAVAQKPAVNAVAPYQSGVASVAVASNPARNAMQNSAQTAARSSSITLAGNAAKLGARTTAQSQSQSRTSTTL
ncbi:MAG: hypothetical protein JWN14_2972, partial [Chthonomonadales bacterium]|nr:hypothetical protein [Chthonomonadales bacterium]